MKQFNRYIVYSFGSARIFFGVTGFQVLICLLFYIYIKLSAGTAKYPLVLLS